MITGSMCLGDYRQHVSQWLQAACVLVITGSMCSTCNKEYLLGKGGGEFDQGRTQPRSAEGNIGS